MKKLISICWCTLLVIRFASAQDAPRMFAIYEHHVNPSRDAIYREGVKKLKSACELHKIDVTWTSIGYDDNTFVHRVPINAFGDLDKNPFAPLEAKIGKEAMTAIWNQIDGSVESFDSFVVMSQPDFSYMTAPVGENFVDVTFWSVLPGKEGEAESIIKEWKKLYEGMKAPNGFAVSKAVFGRDPGFAFRSWGKNPVDLATKEQKTNELLGDEGKKLYAKTLLITRKIYTKRGWILPDLSYAPVAGTAATK